MAWGWVSRCWPPNILAITLCALVLRAMTATWTGLTTDEANGMAIAVTGSWPEMIEHLREDGNPPLFYAIVRLYAALCGHSDLALKLFAVGVSTLVVPVSYLIGRNLVGGDLALSLAAMIALCPPVVRYSTMIRPYGLMPLLALVSCWAFMRIMSKPESRIWPALYGVSTAALVYSHYWGVFTPVGQACAVLVALVRRWIGWRELKPLLAGVFLSLVIFAPWLPTFYHQSTHIIGPWDTPPRFSNLCLTMVSLTLVGAEYTPALWDQMSLLLANFFVLAIMFCPRALVARQPAEASQSGSQRANAMLFDGRLWKAVAGFAVVSAMVFAFFKPAIRDRYFTPFAPLLIVAFLTGVDRLLAGSPRLVRWTLPLALWLPLWLPRYALLTSEPETGTRALVDEIEKRIDKSRDLVVISFQSIAPAITFYLPEDVSVTTFPDLQRTAFNRWSSMNVRLRDPQRLEQLFKRMQTVLDRGGSIFVVDWAHSVWPRDPNDNSVVMNVPFIEADLRRQDQIRTWLDLHASRTPFNMLAPGRDLSVQMSLYRPRPAELGLPGALPIPGYPFAIPQEMLKSAPPETEVVPGGSPQGQVE